MRTGGDAGGPEFFRKGKTDMAQALVGIVGWRGMVGSVLMERMAAEDDFAHIEPLFFSTSNAGGALPASIAGFAKNETKLLDAHDVGALARCDIVLTAQGGDYIFSSRRRHTR